MTTPGAYNDCPPVGLDVTARWVCVKFSWNRLKYMLTMVSFDFLYIPHMQSSIYHIIFEQVGCMMMYSCLENILPKAHVLQCCKSHETSSRLHQHHSSHVLCKQAAGNPKSNMVVSKLKTSHKYESGSTDFSDDLEQDPQEKNLLCPQSWWFLVCQAVAFQLWW